MIDIHCHIIPGFDDGSSCIEESLDMAALACDSGVTDIVCTPHVRCGEDDPMTVAESIEKLYTELVSAVGSAGIPVRLKMGAEILLLPDTASFIERKLLPPLAGGDYMLVEFPFDSPPEYILSLLKKAEKAGYRPVVAHPERYSASRYAPGLLPELCDRGYVLQVNKGSILGAFGSRIRATALEMLDHGICHVIASDAHSSRARTPDMRALVAFLDERYDPEYIAQLLDVNPGRILENREIVRAEG